MSSSSPGEAPPLLLHSHKDDNFRRRSSCPPAYSHLFPILLILLTMLPRVLSEDSPLVLLQSQSQNQVASSITLLYKYF